MDKNMFHIPIEYLKNMKDGEAATFVIENRYFKIVAGASDRTINYKYNNYKI